MSFCIQNHIEEMESLFGLQHLLEERIREMERQFHEDVMQLIMYRRVSSDAAYSAAVYEAYENMDTEMREYVRLFDIDTYSKFLIYIEGIIQGMEIANGRKR